MGYGLWELMMKREMAWKQVCEKDHGQALVGQPTSLGWMVSVGHGLM
jgi:hypothetical protein